MVKFRSVLLTLISAFSAMSLNAGNVWVDKTGNKMPSNGDWTYNYLVNQGESTERRINAVLDGVNASGGVKTVRLTGDICIRHSVFIGLSTNDNTPTTLVIENATDNDIHIWDDLDNPNDGSGADRFGVMFSVWENNTLIIKGDPDGNGKGRIMIEGNANHRSLVTDYGLLESTGNLELYDVVVENVLFNETNARAGECSVLKIHPWYNLENGWTYEQGWTKLHNVEICNITMPGGVGAAMYCYLITQNKTANTRERCTITMGNVNIHNVTQGDTSIDGNGGIVRFRGDWVGNLNMTNVTFKDCTSGASCAGVYWNALGRNTEPCEMTVNGCRFENCRATGSGQNAGAMLIEGRCRFTGAQTRFINNSCTQFGGGLYIHNYNSTDHPQVGESFSYDIGDNVYFEGNSALHGGGMAIYIDDKSTLPDGTSFLVNINGATFNNNIATQEGGAIKINLGTSSKNYPLSLNLNSGNFTGNKATGDSGSNGDGGAIYSWRGNVAYSPSISADAKCSFTGNSANRSGSALYINSSTFSLKTAEIYGNTTAKNDGAIYLVNSSMTMDNGTIHNNHSAGYGGGAFINNSTLYIKEGEICNNTADWRGGGIYITANSSFNLENGKINGNTATKEYGGGVCVYGSTFTMGNGEINNNTAGSNGGGVYYDNDGGNDGKSFSFSGGSISGNKSGGFGGGVCIYTGNKSGCSFNLTGGNISNNHAEAGGGCYFNAWSTYTVNLTNTNVESNTAYMGGGVLMYNGYLHYKNGIISNNRALSRPGSTKPTTMYQVNHCNWDGSKDIVNTDLSGIGGGLCATWGRITFDMTDGKFGIYGNIAEYGADDIFANAKDSQVNLPAPTSMTVTGFDVPTSALFWAQDYIVDDTNYDKKPAAAPTIASPKRYRTMALNLDTQLKDAYIPAGTYSEYICVALGHSYLPIFIKKTGLKVGETAIINLYHKDISDFTSEKPYLQVPITNRTTTDGAEVSRTVYVSPGDWTLVESTWGWSYSGTAEGDGATTIKGCPAIKRLNLVTSSDEKARTFNFVNTKKTTNIEHNEDIKKNDIKL